MPSSYCALQRSFPYRFASGSYTRVFTWRRSFAICLVSISPISAYLVQDFSPAQLLLASASCRRLPEQHAILMRNTNQTKLAKSGHNGPHALNFVTSDVQEWHWCTWKPQKQISLVILPCSSKGRLPEREARHIMQQVVVAIDYCHQLGVVDRLVFCSDTLLF